MSNAKYIVELAKGNMSLEAYEYVASTVKYLINKYNWPKAVLDDNISTYSYWGEDEFLSFTQQLLLFIIEKSKLKNYNKIPENYIEYYFKTILVSYAANKIKEHQNKMGLSFDDTKRVSLEILNDFYFKKEIKDDIFWNKENVFTNPIKDNESINDILAILPKIPITEKTKHYKPRVKTALNDVFNLINRPIKQSVIINQVYKLFDQSSFAINVDEEIANEIRESIVSDSINQIISKIDNIDIPIYLDYFFSEPKKSLNSLAGKYNLPKSTVHYKTNQLAKIIHESFTPENEKEGVWFLENLHKTLDELK